VDDNDEPTISKEEEEHESGKGERGCLGGFNAKTQRRKGASTARPCPGEKGREEGGSGTMMAVGLEAGGASGGGGERAAQRQKMSSGAR
jgi:hypothetical protein